MTTIIVGPVLKPLYMELKYDPTKDDIDAFNIAIINDASNLLVKNLELTAGNIKNELISIAPTDLIPELTTIIVRIDNKTSSKLIFKFLAME